VGANFSSDNVTGACDAVMKALLRANAGLASSYGADDLSGQLRSKLCDLFEKEVSVYPVTTGTAANALALAQITPPFGAVYCHEAAHIVTDECGAPEFFTGGAKLIGLPAADGKISVAQLGAACAFADEMGVHHVKPGAISITQATEWGTVYSLGEVSAIGEFAEQRGLPLHMDGARFANALVQLGCSPARATWQSGVDVLSFGATKNGALAAEVVVFFDMTLAADFDRRRKRAGHLWSKMRFLSAQLLGYLEDEVWLANARQANDMAQRLATGLVGVGAAKLVQKVEANEVFVELPERVVASLEAEFKFYRWPLHQSAAGVAIRLVMSYLTTAPEVDSFLSAVRALSA
jgi:threonine aldolase